METDMDDEIEKVGTGFRQVGGWKEFQILALADFLPDHNKYSPNAYVSRAISSGQDETRIDCGPEIFATQEDAMRKAFSCARAWIDNLKIISP
jgi:hypothetical protein